uniref:Uncharacterized protein n=1 Tax=Chrysotila carterae TaxID=13221 RepID=A0A6S9R8G3_CHRCT
MLVAMCRKCSRLCIRLCLCLPLRLLLHRMHIWLQPFSINKCFTPLNLHVGWPTSPQIVDVMLDEEKADPVLLIEDLKAGGATPGPRIQRLAKASGQPETEVALFLMQFEGMRESTRRIAAGEDPDQVTESMGAAPPGSNRAARRAAKKKKSKK